MTLESFWDRYDYEPDDFQVDAAEAIAAGQSVVVTAPTGAGKTLVAEAATHLSRRRGNRIFYTTPIKALSNQKFADLTVDYPPGEVGLLTGDNVINPDAAIIVATLEVLRNMIYSDPERLDDVDTVILDEAHYLQDRSRGAAWEEVIIHCPSHVRFVCLSATISNNVEFARWVEERRGPTQLVTTDLRPVPLEPMYMIKERSGAKQTFLLPMFKQKGGKRRPNNRIDHMLGLEKGRRQKYRTPNRSDVVEELHEERMLPAIYFIFSRAGCDAAALRLADSGVRLTDSDQRKKIRAMAEERTEHLADGDLSVLDYGRWLHTLESGVAAHHAGLVPAFKETVEELFKTGLIKVVFATETLALGINMPARSVVIENLSKFNGETHELLQPGDFTQLTGRAGRRGIDVEGFGVVLHSPYVKFRQVTEIAAAGSHALKSSFRPTYNMTANLIANYRPEEAEQLLRASFAAFRRRGQQQAADDRARARLDELEELEDQAQCDYGDVYEYLSLVESRGPTAQGRSLTPGTVVDVDGGARDGRYVVLKRLATKKNGHRYLVLSTSGRVSTLTGRQVTDTSQEVATIDLPTPFRPRDRRFIQDTLRRLRKVPEGSPATNNRDNEPLHPVEQCPEAADHLAAARKARRLRKRIERENEKRSRTGFGLVEEFEAIRELLGNLGYIDNWSLTPRGERLRGVYNELDLAVVEAIERGIFWGLDFAEVAALCSVFVYEPRTDQESAPDWPNDLLGERWHLVDALSRELNRLESEYRLTPMRRPDPGFGRVAYQWAKGASFEDLAASSMAPGDFVRVSRQLADLLRQLREAVPELHEEASTALRAIDRGVVSAQGTA